MVEIAGYGEGLGGHTGHGLTKTAYFPINMEGDNRIEDHSLRNIIMTDSRRLGGAVAIIVIAIVAIGQGFVDATKTDRYVGMMIAAIAIVGGGYAVRRRGGQIQRILKSGERASAKVIQYSKGYRGQDDRVTLQFERDGKPQELVLPAGKSSGADDYPLGGKSPSPTHASSPTSLSSSMTMRQRNSNTTDS